MISLFHWINCSTLWFGRKIIHSNVVLIQLSESNLHTPICKVLSTMVLAKIIMKRKSCLLHKKLHQSFPLLEKRKKRTKPIFKHNVSAKEILRETDSGNAIESASDNPGKIIDARNRKIYRNHNTLSDTKQLKGKLALCTVPGQRHFEQQIASSILCSF